MIDLEKITGFDWDEGNTRKNEKHGVSIAEAKQVFLMPPCYCWRMINTAATSRGSTPWGSQMISDCCRSLSLCDMRVERFE
jgi:hypothetical protein